MNRPWKLRLLLHGAALALCLLAWRPAGAQEPTVQPGRAGASRTGEPAALTQLQQQLDALGAGAAPCEALYGASKAQAWINFGKYAVAEQLPHEVLSAALGNAAVLVQALARHEPGSHATPELPGARRVRDDLWRGIAAAEKDGRVCGAPKMTAYCEVQLAWVDYEAAAGGWRHVDPYVRIAEDYCSTAMASEPLPPPAPAVQMATPVAPAQAPEPAPEPDTSVLFAHDRSGRNDIRAPGHQTLRQLAARWKAAPQATLRIVGHADVTGRSTYNLHLSERRARTVAHELQALGVPAGAMRIEAVGTRQEVIQCPRAGEKAERRRYLACLEPNRRVVVRMDNP